MDVREFFRKHLMKVVLGFIALQLVIFALVQNRNHRPQAVADELNLIEGRLVKISPLINDVDQDEKDILALSGVSSPQHGIVKQKGNLLFYQPNNGFAGKDSLTYKVTDGKKESKAASIFLQVIKNQPPVVRDDRATVYEGGTTEIYVIDNDEDLEKDSIFIRDITTPLHGVLKMSGNKMLYTETNSAATSDSFIYTVTDGKHSSKKATVKINIQKKTNPCYPWLSLDIGDVAKPGLVSCSMNGMSVQASGSDIWNNSDGFYFIYQMVSGNCEIAAKVETLEGANEWTKAGLMIRESLSGSSKNAFIGVTTKNGITSQLRPNNHEFSENGENKRDLKAPYWIKLSREGDTCRFSVSPDGLDWKKMESRAVLFSEIVYLGMAVTSHDNTAICKTVFSNYKITGKKAEIRK